MTSSFRTQANRARHSSADLTLNVYGRTRDDRMSAAIERMAKRAIPQEKRVKSVSKQVVGAEQEIATPYKTESCNSIDMAPAVGLEPVDSNSASAAQSRTDQAQPTHLLDLPASQESGQQQNSAQLQQDQDTFSQKKRGICVGKNLELEKVVEKWDQLPAYVQVEILRLIDESVQQSRPPTPPRK